MAALSRHKCLINFNQCKKIEIRDNASKYYDVREIQSSLSLIQFICVKTKILKEKIIHLPVSLRRVGGVFKIIFHIQIPEL